MKQLVVPVKNIARLAEASGALLTRTPGTPGIGLIYGQSGLGKTTATAWFVNECNGVYVRALSTWSPTTMLQTIIRELDLIPKQNRCAVMVEQIIENLKISGRPLFLDEFDYIAEDKKMTETLRDLHDLSAVPVVLIGMQGVRRKIGLREQFVNRIAQFVEFKPADYEDCRLLCTSMCEVEIKEDLLRKLYQASGGVIRLLVIGLDVVERKARTLGLKEIGSEHWGAADFFLMDSAKGKKNGGK